MVLFYQSEGQAYVLSEARIKIMPFLFSKTENKQVTELDIDLIVPSKYQPRKVFSDAALSELSASIKEHGVLQPVLAVKNDDGYSLVAGERRLRASRLAGIKKIPAIILERDSRECAEISLIENIQREQLSFFEEAAGYERLINEFGFTQSQIAQRLGKKQSTVSNKLRLLKLPPTAQVMIIANNLTERHARELLKLRDKQQLFCALDHIIVKKLNVSQTEQYIEELQKGTPRRPQRVCKVGDMRIFVNTINKAVNLIKKSGIKPQTELLDREGFVEYIIKIPKTS